MFERESNMKLNEELIKACLEGDIAKVEECIKLGADVNYQNEFGSPSLHIACHTRNIDMINLLLEANADVNIQNNYGMTALHIASKDGHYDVVNLLTKKDVKVNLKACEGSTALNVASKCNFTKVVDLLLNQEGINIDEPDERGNTALHYACYKGNEHVALALINKGANVNIQNINKISPLHIVSTNGNTKIAEYILEKDGDIALTDMALSTPLHQATEKGNIEIVKLIMQKNREINMLPEDYLNMKDCCKSTALDDALKFSAEGDDQTKEEIAIMLLNDGAKASRRSIDWAVSKKNDKVIELLSKDKGERAYLIKRLLMANEKDRIKKLVKGIRKNGERINTSEKVDDLSILGEVMKSGDIELVKLFLKDFNVMQEKILQLKDIVEDDSVKELLKGSEFKDRKIMRGIKRDRVTENVLDMLYAGGNHKRKVEKGREMEF